jgi:hypothetical protein
LANTVDTQWSCGCNDVYNFDQHEGLSWLCNKGDQCVQKLAKARQMILLPLGAIGAIDG